VVYLCTRLSTWLHAQKRPSRGQGLIEYALIIGLVAIVAIAGLLILGPKLSTLFVNIGGSVLPPTPTP
jgi:pilus assembly protein Flp/PilA